MIVEYCKEGRNCVTPTQVVAALKSNQMSNCISQLVEHNRERLSKLDEYFIPMDKQIKKFIGRSNVIYFSWEPPSIDRHIDPPDGMEFLHNIPPFIISSYDHSGKIKLDLTN